MTNFINIAKAHISPATLNASKGLYIHEDHNAHWVITVEDMEDLGRRIAEGGSEAYSRWCAETDAANLADGLKITQVGDEFENSGVITRYYETQHGAQVMIHHRPNATTEIVAEGYVDGEASYYASREIAEILNDMDQDALAALAGIEIED